ncbi:MAG: phosphoenolpyruvate synthase [Patescibacteria group bacterium]|jgi:pyruvate,water dikinase
MSKKTAHILWFEEIRKTDIPLVGGKGANLGEMYHAGIPVPNGFVVTASTYFEFLKKTSLRQKILTELSGLDVNNSKRLQQAEKDIQTAMISAEMPSDIQEEIKVAYQKLCGEHDRLVAVRSSATAEDLPDASFAGQQESYLNIKGYKDVVRSVQRCWASLFESRAIFYRVEKGYNHFKVGIAVPVQFMVQSEVSGIMFTVNPVTKNMNDVVIEGAFGLGQPIVSGEITPDQYIVGKKSGNIISKNIEKQTWQLTLAGKTPISVQYRETQKLNDTYIKALAQLGMKVEEHYGGKAQDIEWGVEDKKIYIVQSRPVTTLGESDALEETVIDPKKAGKVLLEGLAASPGAASGPVRIVDKASEINRVSQGDVLVAVMTNPDYVPAMKRACAILTDEGGRTSHAAIVSRELGLPAVVGSQSATKMLVDGEVITVDGRSGKVYEGDVTMIQKVDIEGEMLPEGAHTATKIYVNLAEPELALEMAERNVDGVGLLRAEFMIAQMGSHPRIFVKEHNEKAFINALAKNLEKFAMSFDERPVVYRFTDFKTNEYASLKGGKEFEQEEPNPMIGFRGVSRYIEDEKVFRMEIEAIKIVRNKMGHKNLHVMLPFVRTIEELREVKKIMNAYGLRRSGLFHVWMMVEIPSNVIMLDEFIDEGIDGVSIGTNDLTMLTLGVDRDNQKVANVYNEMDPAVLASLEKIVTTCRRRKVTCSVCGQAPSEYPDMVRMLVDWGVTSVSVSPDVLEKTRRIVYDAEKKVLRSRSEAKERSVSTKRRLFVK